MYFKVLNNNGAGIFSGAKWALPRQVGIGTWRPGIWMPTVDDLVVCTSGYHLTDEAHLMEWLGPTIYVAEGRGKVLAGGNKTVFAQARLLRKLDTWNEKSARLFAADVAEHVLPIWEAKFPDDSRPREAVVVARRFANGLATIEELRAARYAAYAAYAAGYAAANAAANAAAYDATNAATNATYDAANAAYAAYAAAYVAYAAANAAVYDAAAYAAYAAGNVAERKWQTAKLMEYLFPTKDNS